MMAPHSVPVEMLEKYAGEFPRYTSYPTAPQFSWNYSDRDYIAQAKASNQSLLPRDLSLYIHIPFCHSLCYFCGCNKVVTQAENNKVKTYIDAVLAEIDLRARLFDSDRRVTQIHFGGGTPNFIDEARLGEILERIAAKFHLDLPSRLEIGIEVDPRAIDADGIRRLAELGFNRFSIGVQDFSRAVQLAINRVQSESATLKVIDAACSVSESVNVDLITGLPAQTVAGFRDTLNKIANTGVTRLAAYNFAYLPNRIKAQKLIDPTKLPSLQERFLITEQVRETLFAAGFLHIGMDHFAKPKDSLAIAWQNNTLQRNFQGYTTQAETDLIGIGASAISQFKTAFAQNATEISQYVGQLQASILPVQKGFNLSDDDVLRAALIQQIMCRNHIDLSLPTRPHIELTSEQKFTEYFAQDMGKLSPFIADDLIVPHDEGFAITPMGGYFRRQIAAQFDSYLLASANKTRAEKIVQFSQAL